MAIHEARNSLARLFGVSSSRQVAFSQNATMALNTAIATLLPDGGTAVTTAASHNSVLRPLFKARDERGCDIRIVPVDSEGRLDYEQLEQYSQGADLMAVTHASNVTGEVYEVDLDSSIAHGVNAKLLLDCAQTAGSIPIDMTAQDIDVICFTGHKSLFGPQGTGGLCAMNGIRILPLVEGGSGVHSFDERQPTGMPESLEAGTMNSHGIAGLGAGVDWILERGVDDVHRSDMELMGRFLSQAADIPGMRIHGMDKDSMFAAEDDIEGRCPIVTFNIGDLDSGLVVDVLAEEWGICARGGAHCAPLMHKALGTAMQGTVRFSFSCFNNEREIDTAVAALSEIAESL